MPDKDLADQTRDRMIEFATDEGAQTMSGAADFLGDLGAIMAAPEFEAALDALPAEQAQEMRAIMERSQAMEALSRKMDAAEQSGDNAALQALVSEFQAMAPVTDYTPDVLDPPYDAIDEAIEDEDVVALKAALAGKPDLNVHLGSFDSFPLADVMRSFGEDRVALAQLLLDHGADAGFATPEGYTALHVLMDSGDREDTVGLINLLISSGAPTEAVNHYGWTPLLQAIMEGSAAMMDALLARGADVHARFSDVSMPPFSRGCTALMGACTDPDKVAVLLAHGADPAGAHDNGRGFNRYADAVQKESGAGAFSDAVEASRKLVNAAKIT